LAAGRPTAWFEYAAGAREEATMPWDAPIPRPVGPWPFTRAEITSFGDHGLDPVAIEQVDDGVPRWRAEFLRSAP
jgi:hypothetical protein